MPPLLYAKGILKQIHKHFSFEFQCSVWRGHFETQSHTHTQTHKCTQTYQFWLCNTPLTCQCPSQVQAAAPKIWDDGWQLYIIILSTNQSGKRLETRYHHRGNLLTNCFHLFSFWVLAQRPQQITQLLLDHCNALCQHVTIREGGIRDNNFNLCLIVCQKVMTWKRGVSMRHIQLKVCSFV